MTTIYHVTYYDDQSVYLFFLNCNLSCKGCIRRLTYWDTHLPLDLRENLPPSKATLSIEHLYKILSRIKEEKGLQRAILGGGEPTTDESLLAILDMLSEFEVKTILATNAYEISRALIKKLSDESFNVLASIKALTPWKYSYYTGGHVERVLRNVQMMYEEGVKLIAETVYIPTLIEDDEIARIAEFISRIDPNIPLRIDAYIPVPGTPWREPTQEEIGRSIFEAKRYLRKVKALHRGMKSKGKVTCLWPIEYPELYPVASTLAL